MATLTPSQMALYLAQAGFSGNDLTTGVAVGIAESAGNANAHNTNSSTGDDSYGFMQINMLGSLGAPRRKQFGITSNDQLFDPATNAKAAHIIFKGSGWSAWSTYKSGAYKSHLAEATTGVAGVANIAPANAGSTSLGDVVKAVNPITGITSAITGFSQTFFNGIASIAGISVALTLLVAGFLLINHKSVGGVSKAVAKVGEVAAL